MEFDKRLSLFCMLIISKGISVAKGSKEIGGHVHVAVEVIDFRNPFDKGRNCCDSSTNNNCKPADICDVRFTLCFGRSSGQWPIHCEGILVNSSTVSTDTNLVKSRTKFEIFGLKSWNKMEKFTIFMTDGDKDKDNSTNVDVLIESLSGSIETEVGTSFWTSKQHIITLNKCASVTLGIRLFCESNYYGKDCNQFVSTDTFHHIDIFNGSTKQVLDCLISGSSVINILTKDPYKYTAPRLKEMLMLFLVDKVCSQSANDVNIKIDNVRYNSGKVRVAFNGDCRDPITDLEVQHALNYMKTNEIIKYFDDSVDRIDETSKIREGRFNIVYRILDVYHDDKLSVCKEYDCNMTVRISYGNESVSNWTLTSGEGPNFCFRGLKNSEDARGNTAHIISQLPAENNAPLHVSVELHSNDRSMKQVQNFDISVLHFTKTAVVGNSYRHFHSTEIDRSDNTTGIGIRLGLFAWCSTGHTGDRCEKECSSKDPDCNYEKCNPPGVNRYLHNLHCGSHGVCNNITKLCDCEIGYIGPMCKAKVDYCKINWAENPCVNGNCTNNAKRYTCQCNQHYTGSFCELRISNYTNYSRTKRGIPSIRNIVTTKSTSNTVKDIIKRCPYPNSCGNGTSFIYKDTIKCMCDIGFIGVKCKQVDHCVTNPCMHGGLCQNTVNGYSCTCKNGFRGVNCDMVNECRDSFCLHNATCMNITVNNIKCICKKGFAGRFCQALSSCKSKKNTHETKCSDHDNAKQTSNTPNTSSTSLQRLFVKLLPAYKPHGLDYDNITESMKTLFRNITDTCTNVKIMFDVYHFTNGSTNVYIGVLCDGKLLSARLIGQQFEHFPIEEIINILHFIPTASKTKPAADVKHAWIEENWIILTGVLVAVIAVLIGIIKSFHIIYGTGHDRTVKRKISTVRRNNHDVNSNDVFENGTRTLQKIVEANKPRTNPGHRGPGYDLDSPSGRQEKLRHDKNNGFNSPIYGAANKEAMSSYEKVIKASKREPDTEDINLEFLDGQEHEGRFSIQHWNSEQNFRNSYIDSKMSFLARNPIYGLSSNNW